MTPLQIKNKIELDFGITIKKQCKLREYVYPRAIYFKLCREYTELTLQELAESVGLTNHATVSKSYKQYLLRCNLREQVQELLR